MKLKNEIICVNCQIHEENKKAEQKNQQKEKEIQEFREKSNSQLSDVTLNTYKTNTELNQAEIKLPKINEEKGNQMMPEINNNSSQPLQNNNDNYSQPPQNNSSNIRKRQFRSSLQLKPRNQSYMRIVPQSDIRHNNSNNNNQDTNNFDFMDEMSVFSNSKKDFIVDSISSNPNNLETIDEINQIYLHQIKIALKEIKNDKKYTEFERFQKMKSVMDEYKKLIQD